MTKLNMEQIAIEARDFSNWEGHAIVYYFKSTNTTETYVYASNEEWTEFDNPDDVFVIMSKDEWYNRGKRVSAQHLAARIQQIIDGDYTVDMTGNIIYNF
jgi:hypothetical protein